MSFNDILILALIGLSAGIVSGLLGVGGAIIIVPALVFFFGLTQHQAQGTSLGILLLPIGFLAFWNYYKQGYVNFKIAIVVALAFFIGGYLGSVLAVRLPERTLKIAFGILIVFLGIRMIFKK
ncbi:MAG: sulfite exporter TauE/SafE family protein [Bacteroidales bacterium]|nr:sulfite exporter TauE/SafE family protein [Bacteroidales bacterium]